MMRLALFGGTFDPIHSAHLRVAGEAADEYALDQVWFVTAANPPHKTNGNTTPYAHRHRMVELACAADARFRPSRLEEGSGKSYTVLTLERVRQQLAAGDELYFLIGADAFAEVGTWHRVEEVLGLTGFIVVSRPGYEYPVPAGARVSRLETLALEVSSSGIRRRLEAGERVDEVPAAVHDYILMNGLYRAPALQ